jgi:RNA polymerase sigma factor (sigma-70 family)
MATDSTVWKELFHHHNEIYNYINSLLKDSEASQDICQDVYVQAYKNIDKLEIDKNVRAWLYRVAKNTSLNYIKSRNIRRHSELTDMIPEQNDEQYNETNPFIEKAFAKLPERQQEALRYREIDGYSYDDLAEKLGLSVSAVTSLLSRARDNFQRNYLISLLPTHYASRIERMQNMNDILRLIDPENPPMDIFHEIESMTVNYFRNVSHIWDEIRNNFFSPRDLNSIFERIDFNYTETLLDLGTGTGFIPLHFATYIKEAIGLDNNNQMLETAVKNKNILGVKNVSFVHGNIEEQPFYGRRFDIIVCNLVLHHLVEPFKALRGLPRLLSRGSKLIIVDFKRHTNKELADSMKDIWLGFDIKEVTKTLQELTFTRVESFTIKEKRENIPEIFCILATY